MGHVVTSRTHRRHVRSVLAHGRVEWTPLGNSITYESGGFEVCVPHNRFDTSLVLLMQKQHSTETHGETVGFRSHGILSAGSMQ